MRLVLVFLCYALLALLIGALLAYPVFALIRHTGLAGAFLGDPGFAKVTRRCVMISGLAGLWPLLRILGLSSLASLGYAGSGKDFLSSMAVGFAQGGAILVPLAGALIFLDIRIIDSDRGAVAVVPLLLQAMLTGAAVALIEETFFRGALLTAALEHWKPPTAVAIISVVFAALHFIRGESDYSSERLDWLSGLHYLSGAFHKFQDPAFIGSFIALAAIGVSLSMLRLKNGHIGQCIGVHAGFVFVVKILQGVTHSDRGAELAFLVGNHDRITGYLAFVWISGVTLLYWFYFVRGKEPDRA